MEELKTEPELTLTLDIVKKYICPQATDQEAYTFLQLCKAQNLNPFLKEAYLIKYGTAPATIVTGKETFTKRADKLPQYDGFKAGIIVYSNDKVVYREGCFYTTAEQVLGGWAEVYRKDRAIPFRNEVKLEEYMGKKTDGTPTKMWAEKKATMIRKVPLVQSLREAFPVPYGGLYSPEEINTVDALPVYEMGKAPVVQPPSQIKLPQSKTAKDTDAAADDQPDKGGVPDTQSVITTIAKLTQKVGDKNGKKFTLYKLLGENEIIYTTFDKNLATVAKSAHEAGLEVRLSYKADKYNTVQNVELIEPSDPVQKELAGVENTFGPQTYDDEEN